MALAIATITDSIAALEIEGVKVLDKDELKAGFTAYDCPLLAPLPNGFMSAPQITAVNMGTGTARKLNVTYTLTYRYFHAPIGQGELEQTWSEMVDNVAAILDVIFVSDALTGAIDFNLQGISEFGMVQDGSNNLYHGCDLTFSVMEFVN